MKGVLAFGLGATAGAFVGLGLWWWARRDLTTALETGGVQLARQLGVGAEALERQLTAGRQELLATLQEQVSTLVPPVVDRQLRSTLTSYGITPVAAQRVARALEIADRYGVL